jgi:hypothetical protein
MNAFFLVTLLIGLLAAVQVMLSGVERPPTDGTPGAGSGGEPRDVSELRTSPAVIAVGGVVFGALGYLLRRIGLGPMEAFVAAFASAALASAGTVRLVKRWWMAPVEHDTEDPRYLLQGHLAKVVSPISPGHDGEITFRVDTEDRRVRARGLDAEPLAVGTEVVIERLEDDIAFVETWTEVEKRL